MYTFQYARRRGIASKLDINPFRCSYIDTRLGFIPSDYIPEKWQVLITEENIAEMIKWRGNCTVGRYIHRREDGYPYCCERRDGFFEITTEQWRKYLKPVNWETSWKS